MQKKIAIVQAENAPSIMMKLGYQFHCGKDDRPCYHRPWNDARFPRFHAYVTDSDGWMKIDIHVDALDTIHHRGNHGQSWAYEGGRIVQEMQRITDAIEGTTHACMMTGTERLTKKANPKRAINKLIDFLLF